MKRPKPFQELRDFASGRDFVAIVLVNWNGWKDTIACCESIKRSKFKYWKVIIVDNASSDDSIEHLSNLGDRFTLIKSDRNLGFSGGCNLAARRARELGASHLFFLNNDATVEPDTLLSLVEYSLPLEEKAVLGSVVRYSPSGDLQFIGSSRSEIYGVPEWENKLESDLSQKSDLIESDFIIGAALFVPMKLWNVVGEFDDRFFLNYEEVDWCYRAMRASHKCYVVKSSVVHHKGNSSIGGSDSPMQTYFVQRNELLFSELYCNLLHRFRIYTRTIKTVLYTWRDILNLSGSRRELETLAFRARLLALRDYVFRRFGDCPRVVRQLAQDYRALESAGRGLTSSQEN